MRFTLALLLALAAAPATAQPAGPTLDDKTYAAHRDSILPKPADEAWRAIPWRTNYWEAVVEGNSLEKPILLWTMNGHPLACT
jgi:hypothetical protein